MKQEDVIILFLQLSVLLSVALIGGNIARRFRQPAVFGELIGGVILGPTIFGSWAPKLFSYIFKTSSGVIAGREIVVKVGLLLFLFVAGMEIRFASLRCQIRAILGSSILGMIIPFSFGLLAVYWFPSLWYTQITDQKNFALFIGTALSISALPVISRILMDMDLIATKLGEIIMSSAALDDLVGWTIFVIILKNQIPGSMNDHIIDTLGIYAVFIAFLAGAVFRSIYQEGDRKNKVCQCIINFAGPMYFVAIGLKVNFISNFDWLLVLTIFFIACLGKIIGVTLGAFMFGRLPFKEALAVGFAMNARGAIEIVLASIALDYRLIDERIFVALVVMALGTSILSGVMLKRLIPAPSSIQGI